MAYKSPIGLRVVKKIVHFIHQHNCAMYNLTLTDLLLVNWHIGREMYSTEILSTQFREYLLLTVDIWCTRLGMIKTLYLIRSARFGRSIHAEVHATNQSLPNFFCIILDSYAHWMHDVLGSDRIQL